MNLNNISFPYPVLGSYDDILPAPSQPKVSIDQDKINHIFDITLESNNSEVDALVADDFADYVFEVTCDLTRYRRCYKSKTPKITILIPRKSVAGRIVFNCTVTVKKDKQAYVYASGPKSGTKFKIIHECETYTYLGEKDGYYKIQVGGKTGWVNSQYMKKNGFSQGGFIADLQKVAYQNGDDILSFNTLKRGEAVLDRTETVQFKRLTDYLPQLQGLIDISDYLKNIGNFGGTSNNEANIDVGGITIQIDHVQDYNDFVRKLRDDKTFERMISSMTIDKLAGKSSLAKKKYYD